MKTDNNQNRLNENQEIQSLNENLNTEFHIKELEERLETDPMLLANPADASIQLSTDLDCFTCNICFSCSEFMV